MAPSCDSALQPTPDLCVLVCPRPEAGVLLGELNVMSERFSQKCLELNRAEQSSKSRETELDRKQRELDQLQRENQVVRY